MDGGGLVVSGAQVVQARCGRAGDCGAAARKRWGRARAAAQWRGGAGVAAAERRTGAGCRATVSREEETQ